MGAGQGSTGQTKQRGEEGEIIEEEWSWGGGVMGEEAVLAKVRVK